MCVFVQLGGPQPLQLSPACCTVPALLQDTGVMASHSSALHPGPSHFPQSFPLHWLSGTPALTEDSPYPMVSLPPCEHAAPAPCLPGTGGLHSPSGHRHGSHSHACGKLSPGQSRLLQPLLFWSRALASSPHQRLVSSRPPRGMSPCRDR